jgi:hypothetical protein
MLGLQPLRYLGERSYAIYLWHWPVCLLTRPGLDVPITGWANAGLRIAVSIVLAEVSYQLIEKPIRRYGFLAPLRRKKSTVDTTPAVIPAQAGPVAVRSAAAAPGPFDPAALRTPSGQHPVRVPTGQHALHTPTGQHALRTPTGQHALRIPTGQQALRGPTPLPRGAGVYVSAGHGSRPTEPPPAPPSAPPSARPLGPIVRTLMLTVAMIAGGTFVGMRLNVAAGAPAAGGPRDLGADVALGPLSGPNATPGPVPVPPKPVPPGSTVAFFGDSQGMTLLLNKPPDLANYIEAVDATIEGCGILLGKVESRSGERRNLTTNCANWRSVWTDRTAEYDPVLAVIMLGAWDVFDLTLGSGQTLKFGSPGWDANFTDALRQAVTALRSARTDVALALLPCYRPIEASAGFWPERGDDERTRHVNELLLAHAKTYLSGVRTLEPPAEFCADPVIAADTAYRWDGVHYYKRGAALYFGAMLPQIMPPPPPEPTPTPAPTV